MLTGSFSHACVFFKVAMGKAVGIQTRRPQLHALHARNTPHKPTRKMSGKGAKGLSGKGLSGKGAKGTMKGGDKKKPTSRSVSG